MCRFDAATLLKILLATSMVMIASGFAWGESPANVNGECSAAPPIADATTFQGQGELRINGEGTILLALDATGDSRADALFRIATHTDNPALRARVDSAAASRPIQVVQRDAVEYHDLEISGSAGQPSTLRFVIDRRDCARDRPKSGVAASGMLAASAISRETSQHWTRSPAQLVSDRMDEPLVTPRTDPAGSSGGQGEKPRWCMAGGEGAAACSLSIDPGGAHDPGECAIACSDAPVTYACCGPASPGPRCHCIVPDSASTHRGGGS
jgi:hypothetical protein